MKKNPTHLNRAAVGARPAITAGLLAVGMVTANASTDYGPAIWNPLPNYYTSGSGHKFHVIHDMEGYYHSVKSVLQNQGLSVHYATNGKKDSSTDAAPGAISQFVRDAHYGIHARCWNTHSTGTEHEGFASNPAWFTAEQYQASAGITAHLSAVFGWAKDRNHVVGHNAKSSSAWVSYAGSNLGVDGTCNTHSDPGPYWDWTGYMALVNGGGGGGGGAGSNFRSVIANADGRLELFAIGMDNTANHIWQQTTGGWSPWAGLAGGIVRLAPGRNVDGRVELFAIGTDGALNHKWQTSPNSTSWSGWAGMGGNITELTVIANSDGRLEAFGIGTNKALFHTAQTSPNSGTWSPWESLGGGIVKIAAGRNADGRVEVFAIGTDAALNHIWQQTTGGWSSWGGMGGGIVELTVGANSDGRLEVFAIGTDGAVNHRAQVSPNSGSWSTWEGLGGGVVKIDVGRNADGRLEIFAIGTNGALNHKWQQTTGGWSSWAGMGGGIVELTVGSNSDGRLEVFAIGTNTAANHIAQQAPNSGSWYPWEGLGGTFKRF